MDKNYPTVNRHYLNNSSSCVVLNLFRTITPLIRRCSTKVVQVQLISVDSGAIQMVFLTDSAISAVTLFLRTKFFT